MTETRRIDLTMEEAIARLRPDQRPQRDDLASANSSSRIDWDLNTPFDRAAELAEFGWRERVGDVEAYLSEIKDVLRESWATELDVTGEAVDIGAFLEGVPECMLSFSVPQTQAVRIVASISARCSADAPRLLNRGIAIAAVVYALQCSGTPVSLAVGDWVSGHGQTFRNTVEVNPYGDYIDAGRLAFWLGHPAALRRCMFRYQEQEPDHVRQTFGFHSGGGYGTPTDPSSESEGMEGVVYIPFPETSRLSDYETPERAFRTIRDLLATKGITLQLRSS
ncbi:MAG: phage Whirlwind [Pseudomonadota bacterium]|jgi:hypothetical protein